MFRKSHILFILTFTFLFISFHSIANCPGPQAPGPKPDTTQSTTISDRINNAFTPVVDVMTDILFWDPFAWSGVYDDQVYDEHGEPVIGNNGEPVTAPLKLIVLWLIFGGLFFTVFMRFINIRGFRHAIGLIRGRYDDPNDKGEVSHFQALTTALSATVGLGNIAGVAIGITIGGPGATFWMVLAGLIGMSSKFVECTLGVKYRRINKHGEVSGGAMYYLRDGLKNKGMKWLGLLLAFLFAILVIGGSIGGGNMFQSNQAFHLSETFFPGIADFGAWYGLGLAFLVGLVIIGGIKSIARVTSKIVPFMGVLYVLTAMVIIGININYTGTAFQLIFDGAFSPEAMKGGFIGVLIYGFQRGAFSNEAGIGSASIAHSAARTDEPVSEGIVALLEPFVDTVVICTMTALVIIFSGHWADDSSVTGVQLTSAAFGSVFPWFPYLLLVAVTLFAFSTLISWSYYGLKGFDYLLGGFGKKIFGTRKVTNVIYQLFFLACVVIGASSDMAAVTDFSDMMILCMAFPNIVGLLILAPEVRRDLVSYMKRLKSGE
ncbi:MAG: alanine/glycine:cation symporter family protein, partial [Bacteroidales bacterium]|nr:alanine/glycine:cation symporter family protein [Bacteroidales bacterium]